MRYKLAQESAPDSSSLKKNPVLPPPNLPAATSRSPRRAAPHFHAARAPICSPARQYSCLRPLSPLFPLFSCSFSRVHYRLTPLIPSPCHTNESASPTADEPCSKMSRRSKRQVAPPPHMPPPAGSTAAPGCFDAPMSASLQAGAAMAVLRASVPP
ncbi:hypothetical protein PVAP13_7KG250000 [Panicum virgatum]|uniref:Uncharacterized protein n=1 Tax=Panicum virgatum TaxID=38727 RepID=A0A8T0QKT6_PANVG|nr:hypothetical protein PVAP13_7KG250000 [Panicum virgatum]